MSCTYHTNKILDSDKNNHFVLTVWDNSQVAALKKSRLGEVTTLSGSVFRSLDNSLRKEAVFKGILASMNLTERYRMAISGYPMGGLYIFR